MNTDELAFVNEIATKASRKKATEQKDCANRDELTRELEAIALLAGLRALATYRPENGCSLEGHLCRRMKNSMNRFLDKERLKGIRLVPFTQANELQDGHIVAVKKRQKLIFNGLPTSGSDVRIEDGVYLETAEGDDRLFKGGTNYTYRELPGRMARWHNPRLVKRSLRGSFFTVVRSVSGWGDKYEWSLPFGSPKGDVNNIESADLPDDLQAWLAVLPERTRRVVTMRACGLSRVDIAKELACTEASVRWAEESARSAPKEHLNQSAKPAREAA